MTARLPAAIALAVFGLLLCAGAGAQNPHAIADVPTGAGTLSGRAVTPDGEPVPHAPVSLIAFQPSGQQGLTRAETDADGRFSFGPIANDPEITYFVVVESGGVHHSWRTSFEPERDTAEVEVEIAPTRFETGRATRGRSDLAVERSCSGLRVLENHHFSNPTSDVIFVPEGDRDDAVPLLEVELPEGAGPIANRFGALPTGMTREGRRVLYWGPLYPGEQEFAFSYEIAGDGDRVAATWRHPNGTGAMLLQAAAEVTVARVAGLLESEAPETSEARRFAAPALEPGAEVTLEVSLASAPPLATVSEAQVWIELDDAALSVDEHLSLVPSPDATDASRLCIALPPDAARLRFSRATLALPISRDSSGALEVRGPLPEGESVVTLSYRLPVDESGARYARRFGVPLPLLGVLVSDTGVRPETDRLHRRRTARRVERNYLHLEGFEIEAREEVEIGFRRLPAPRALPGVVGTGFAVALAAGLVAFLGAPLRSGARASDPRETTADRLAAERAGIYAAIAGLDEDFDTGKLTADDHRVLREELRSRAIALLDAERRADDPESAQEADAPDTAEPARPCAGCRGQLPAGARFCPHCGVRLAESG